MKNYIFAYNLWTVWPKIIKMVSLDSVHHAESNHIWFPCQPFWASAMLNFVVIVDIIGMHVVGMAQCRNTAGSLRTCFYNTHQVSSQSVKPLRRYSFRSICACFSANSLVWYSRTLGRIDLNFITLCHDGPVDDLSQFWWESDEPSRTSSTK